MSSFAVSFEIQGRTIGADSPCFVIAEGGVSHFGEMRKAEALIDMSVSAGADCFKTQHFDVNCLVGSASPEWRERLASKQMPNSSILEMRDICHRKGIPFLCTPHDESALTFLHQELDVSAFKIGSGEVLNWPYLAKIASLGKPIILSTGMYQLEDIRDAIRVIEEAGCRELAILHCVTAYPTNPKDVNLSVMGQIREFFEGPVGYSDHTEGTATPLAAVALGAKIIEKHITLERNIPNAQDWKVSCDPSNFTSFVSDIREIEESVGGHRKSIGPAEEQSILWARKSLTVTRDLPVGHKVAPDDVIAQRPGTGIPPSRLNDVLGKTLVLPILDGEMITLDHFAR